MDPKATSIEEAAVECAAALTPDDIESLRLHICYTYHHFGYGLGIRNTYGYLLKDERYSHIHRDSLSS